MALDPAVLEALRRNSGVHVTRDGVFEFHGRPVDNTRVRALFHSGLVVRDDGEVILTVGAMWAYVTCDSAARFVRALDDRDGVLTSRLLDGTMLTTDAPVVAYGPDDRFYLWLDATEHPAIALREAHQFLASRGQEGGAIKLGGAEWPIHMLEAVPTPRMSRPGLLDDAVVAPG
ncbi:MAG: hypothetical protein ACI9MR_003515 [Myxococcota bacterium]|jgi:hypothetical protein